MAVERTLSIIKPDAVAKNVIGQIYSRFENAGLAIVAAKMLHLTQEQAQGFYAEHKERPFFGDLVEFMTSGPVTVQVLEGEYQSSKRASDLQIQSSAVNCMERPRFPFFEEKACAKPGRQIYRCHLRHMSPVLRQPSLWRAPFRGQHHETTSFGRCSSCCSAADDGYSQG